MRTGVIIALLAASAGAQAVLPAGNSTAAKTPKSANASAIPSNPSAALNSTVAASPAADKARPPQCKVIPGDAEWPADDVWKKEIPGVVKTLKPGNDTSPTWLVNARGAADVQAAVKFASKYNVRVSVYASGHDFLGRNDAPNGLWINTFNIKGCQVHEEYSETDAGIPPIDYTKDCLYGVNTVKPTTKQAAVTLGVGVTGHELTHGLDKSGLNTVTAATSTVSVVGGFAQMGGHGPLTPAYGLAADLILEWQVVTPDGKLVIANSRVNPDLYNALRGGGGGTFGVVIQATIKAFPTPQVQMTRYWLRVTNDSDTVSIYKPVAHFHSLFQNLSAQGVQGYYYVLPYGLVLGMNQINSNEAQAKKLWQPIFAELEAFPNMQKGIVSYRSYPTYKAFYDVHFGQLAPFDPTAPQDLESPAPHGNAYLDSWLMGPQSLKHPNLAEALRVSMPNMETGMFRGHLLSGGKVHDEALGKTTSVNPAWRTAYGHIIATGQGGVPNVTAIKELDPKSGSYANENLGSLEADWKERMWGSKYQGLYSVKQKYDPNGLLWVTPGIGADDYAIFSGRLCRVQGLKGYVRPANPLNLAPVSDNKNQYHLPQTEVPFPWSQTMADWAP